MTTHKSLHVVFGLFGNICGLLLFLAPTITFKRIICSKSTQEFSGIPYVVALLNCCVSGWYGFVTPGNFLVFTLSAAGATLELAYILIFLVFAPKREKGKIFSILTLVLVLFGTVVLISKLVFHDSGRQRMFCGIVSTLTVIAMYASPLSVMRLVIRTKSTEYMPFFLSLFMFLCGTSWFIFGLLENDPFLSVPNGLGSGLGAMQLILYSIYRDKKDDGKPRVSTNKSTDIRLSPAQLEKQSDLKL